MIYLDNAATTRVKPQAVVDAVCQALCAMGNAGRGQHEDSLSADRVIYEARCEIADLFGAANPRQVVFTKNSTEALNIAIRGLFNPGDHIITTCQEHNSVLRPLYALEDEGLITLDFVGLDEHGQLKMEQFESLIQDNTAFVVVNHGSNVTGNLADLAAIGKLCKEHSLKLVVDASQTAGVFPIDMGALGISVLCFTGHKSLLGPQGTGGLCASADTMIRPLLTGGSGIRSFDRHHPPEMPTRLEAGTLNGHGLSGLLAALRYIKQHGMEHLRAEEQSLARKFYEGIRAIEGIQTYGDFSTTERCPIVSLNVRDLDAALVSFQLQEDYGIATRPGAHCAPLVHAHFGTEDQGMVRFSFSSFNTEAEVQTAIDAVRQIARDSAGCVKDKL